MTSPLSELLDQTLANDLAKLPPGPWSHYGGSVYAGRTQVALVLHPSSTRATEIARVFSRLPDMVRLLSIATPDVLNARIERMNAEALEREARILELERQNAELRRSIAEMVC